MKKTDYIAYASVMALFILLKAWYSHADGAQVDFLLRPTDGLVRLFTGQWSQLTTQGYYYPSLSIVIEKSCSGFNFWILSFVMSSFVCFTWIKKTMQRMLLLPLLLLCSWLLTIFVNASRILASIQTNALADQLAGHPILWLHEAEGAFIYLISLIGLYFLLHYILQPKLLTYEKAA